jgi:hypothetical protein
MKRSLWVVVSLAILVFAGNASAQTCTPPPDGMVAWWPADDEDASDISGNGNDGTAVGAVTFPTGKVGKTFSFSGGWVSVPGNTSLEPTAVTVDAWVRRNGYPGGARYIVGKGGTGCSHSSYALYTGSACPAPLSFYVAVPSGGSPWTCSPGAVTDIYDGEWHHIAGTYDGTRVHLYVDGVEQGIGTLTSGSIAYGLPATELLIGQYPGTCSLPFPGEVDEVEVFNRALNLGEIQAIYNAGSAGKCKGPTILVNIKRGSDPNSINTCSGGATPVTIWGSASFDVSKIDPSQLTLASADVKTVGKSNRELCSIKDVGSYDESLFDKFNPEPDGHADMTCHFTTYNLGLNDASTTASMNIVGCDAVALDPTHTCTPGDAGYFDVTLDPADFVNIVKDCQ